MMAKTHVIDGVTYVEVDRKAEVGDKILITEWFTDEHVYNDVCVNEVLTVDHARSDGSVWDICERVIDAVIMPKEYHVLEPVKPTLAELLSKCTPENRHEEVFVDTTQASPEVIDLLANLARRVTSLETQLRDTQGNLEKQAIEFANTRHRLAKHADRFAAIEDQIEMLTDDIVTLDSRSQVLNAINKYYAEGSR